MYTRSNAEREAVDETENFGCLWSLTACCAEAGTIKFDVQVDVLLGAAGLASMRPAACWKERKKEKNE